MLIETALVIILMVSLIDLGIDGMRYVALELQTKFVGLAAAQANHVAAVVEGRKSNVQSLRA